MVEASKAVAGRFDKSPIVDNIGSKSSKKVKNQDAYLLFQPED